LRPVGGRRTGFTTIVVVVVVATAAAATAAAAAEDDDDGEPFIPPKPYMPSQDTLARARATIDGLQKDTRKSTGVKIFGGGAPWVKPVMK